MERQSQSYEYWIKVFEFVRSKETVDSLALPLPYLLAYSTGGHSMLFKWADGGMTIPSAELIEALQLEMKINKMEIKY